MSLPITSAALRSVTRGCSRLLRSISGRSLASSPNTRKLACGWRTAARASPETIASGALSPPIASTARILLPLIFYLQPIEAVPNRQRFDKALKLVPR